MQIFVHWGDTKAWESVARVFVNNNRSDLSLFIDLYELRIIRIVAGSSIATKINNILQQSSQETIWANKEFPGKEPFSEETVLLWKFEILNVGFTHGFL